MNEPEVLDDQAYRVTITLVKVRNHLDLVYQLSKVFTNLSLLGDRINLRSMSVNGSFAMSRLGLFKTGFIRVKIRDND